MRKLMRTTIGGAALFALLLLTDCYGGPGPVFRSLFSGGTSEQCRAEIANYQGCNTLAFVRFLNCDESGGNCVLNSIVEYAICSTLISEQCYDEYENSLED